MQIKTIQVYHFLPIWQKAKGLTIYYAGGTVDKQALSHTAGGNSQSTHLEENMKIFSKIAYICPLLAIILLEISSKIPWQKREKKCICTRMYTAAICVIAKEWK